MDVLCGLDAGALDSRAVRVGEAIMRVDGLFDLTIVHTFSERRTNTYLSELEWIIEVLRAQYLCMAAGRKWQSRRWPFRSSTRRSSR